MAHSLLENLSRTTLSLTDDCLRAVCFHLDTLEDIKSCSKVCQGFRQAALYRLSRMSLTIAVDNYRCNYKQKNAQDLEWRYVVRGAHNSVSVTHPLAIQHNEALVRGIHRIWLYQLICPTWNEEQFVTLRETLNQLTAVTQFCWSSVSSFQETALGEDNDGGRDRSQACPGHSPAAVLFDLCEPFFQQLLEFEIESSHFKFVGSDLELLCNMLCGMPKLVDVYIMRGIIYDSFLKLSRILHGKGTSGLHVLSAITKISSHHFTSRKGANVTDFVAAASEYPNLVNLTISCPQPNNRADLTPLRNLTKLKSLGLDDDLGLMFVIPSQLTVVTLTLRDWACSRFSVAAQFLKACQSLSELWISQPHQAVGGSCTFPEFLTIFEKHANLTRLTLDCGGQPHYGQYMYDELKHFRSHYIELALRAPTCLKHLHFSLRPGDWTAEEEMQLWESMVKVARTQTLHIKFGFQFEDSLAKRLTTAMQQSAVKELWVDVGSDRMERSADGSLALHYASVVTGTRPGNDVPFRIEFLFKRRIT